MSKTKEPSEEFLHALELSHGGGGCRAECEFCKRVTYNPNGGWTWDEGELEDLDRRNEEDSDKCIAVDYAVPIAYLDGKQYVIGCPCNSARQYEVWIWSHGILIAEYLKLKAERIAGDAECEVKTSEKVQAAMKALEEVSEAAEKAAEESAERLMSLGKRTIKS